MSTPGGCTLANSRFVAAVLACMLFVRSLYKFPVEGFIIFSGQKTEKLQAINRRSFSPSCVVGLLYSMSPGFYLPSLLLGATMFVMLRG